MAALSPLVDQSQLTSSKENITAVWDQAKTDVLKQSAKDDTDRLQNAIKVANIEIDINFNKLVWHLAAAPMRHGSNILLVDGNVVGIECHFPGETRGFVCLPLSFCTLRRAIFLPLELTLVCHNRLQLCPSPRDGISVQVL
jgi:glycine cleavage system pyridoxal-binding protein P